MQVSRPCVLLAPLQIRLDVELHHYVASRFLIDSVVLIKRFPSLNEMQLHPMVRTSLTSQVNLFCMLLTMWTTISEHLMVMVPSMVWG